MTEAEWLTSDEPDRMLEALRYKGSARKRRLYACALCRGEWYYLTDERSRKAIAVAERYADGLASEQDLVEAERSAQAACDVASAAAAEAVRNREAARPTAEQETLSAWQTAIVAMNSAKAACYCCAVTGYDPSANVDWYLSREGESAVLEVIKLLIEGPGFVVMGLEVPLRDIFGNPFRPAPAIEPAWLRWNDSTVPKIAEGIYSEHRFEELPILADALEEAGCGELSILAHCREAGWHARGCWVLDRLLAKG